MKALNCRSAKPSTCDSCQSKCDMAIHGVLLWLSEAF
jgi:hypothetical protein